MNVVKRGGAVHVEFVQHSLNDCGRQDYGDGVDIERRAAVFAALGDPARLAIVDELRGSDRSPGDLARRLSIRPSLLAFHLDQLERVGIVTRHRSAADRRRRYVRIEPAAFDDLISGGALRVGFDPPDSIVFVCTRNSARSQLAAALWRHHHHRPATSAGTEPADTVHPGAIAAAHRAGIDLTPAAPRLLTIDDRTHDLITVCDHAHERLDLDAPHWSIPDPVDDGTPASFDRSLRLIRDRILAFRQPPTDPLRRLP